MGRWGAGLWIPHFFPVYTHKVGSTAEILISTGLSRVLQKTGGEQVGSSKRGLNGSMLTHRWPDVMAHSGKLRKNVHFVPKADVQNNFRYPHFDVKYESWAYPGERGRLMASASKLLQRGYGLNVMLEDVRIG